MMKKILKIATWIGITAWFVVILGFVSSESNRVLCNRMDVNLSDTVLHRFVTRADIRHMLEEGDFQLQGYPIDEINTRRLETTLEKNAYIRNAEVSTDVSGRLEVNVEQRVPLVRIMPEGKRGYYLDTEGVLLPLSDQYTPLILLASGNIPSPEQNGEANSQLGELFGFCTYLLEHPLWKEQIVQIYVNKSGEYELIPRVGAHHILMGGLEKWEVKLRNLELLYKQGLSQHGWNSYGTINLKYTNQVICTKR
jgi:cell division protein FtsQ